MAQCGIKESYVMSEECSATQAVEQGNHLGSVLHSPASDIRAYVVKVNPPGAQGGTLAENNIFIKNVQPARRMVFFSERDRPASRTASAIASRLIAPS